MPPHESLRQRRYRERARVWREHRRRKVLQETHGYDWVRLSGLPYAWPCRATYTNTHGMEIAESPQGLIAESNSREKAIDIDHLRTNSNLKNEGISQPYALIETRAAYGQR